MKGLGGLGRAENSGRLLRLGLLALLAAVCVMVVPMAAQAAPDPVPSPTAGTAPEETPGPKPDAGSGDDGDAGGGDAEADDEPTPDATPNPKDATKPPKQVAKEQKQKAAKEKADKRAAWDKKVKEYKERHNGGGVLGPFTVTDEDDVPADAYQVTVDSGGITDPEMKFQGILIEGMFAFTKWMIAFACWLIAWALSWSLAAILLKPALTVSESLYSQAVVQLGLPALLIAVSGTVVCFQLFFGSRARGWGEIAASTLISALAVTTFAAPPQMLLAHDDGAVGEVRALGLTVAALVLDREEQLPGDGQFTKDAAKQLTRPMTDALVNAFIVQPAMQLSYDQAFNGRCAQQFRQSRVEQALYDEEFDKKKKGIQDAVNQGTVTEKPKWAQTVDNFITGKVVDWFKDQFGDDVSPSEQFEKDCVDGDAGTAKKTSWDKVGGAAFVTFAAFLVVCLIVYLSAKFLISQALIALDAMFARVAVTAGIMPGPGRAWLWERAVNVLRLLASLVAVAVGLAVFIMVVTSVLGAKPGDIPGGLTIRFVVVDLMCIAAFIFRKKLAARGRAWAAEARTRMGSSRFGGRAPAQLDSSGPRRSKLGAIVGTGLLMGAMAATGGGSALAMGGSASLRGTAGARLAARGIRLGGKAAAKSSVATAKAVGKVGKFGVKYTAGAPVSWPRAARRATTATRAVPGRTHAAATSARERISDLPHSRVAAYAQEWGTNAGVLPAVNRARLRRGQAPVTLHRPRPRPPASPRTPATPRTVRPPATTGPAPVSPARRPARPVPAPVPQAPASAGQARLQLRAHRARMRNTPAPAPSTPAARPLPRTPTPPAARRRRSGGRGRR
ncbi:hypothetical protein DSC45_34575 [Streptomyces sp. YIM 130001]|uniref:hypothetical protein n=1 Tax=Streptomyces sp. YIM 130001 TaxID=2259644 RepID=UPI000E658B75|nr:hypothetical protein [Streptomyces sp. YIM 130001]RII06955.1 hypothetical protein DSC45_34575 [Streptomyces sp. YIM 130001]